LFQWVLAVLAEKKLLKETATGVDATTLEANAALRSIVRRDTRERYDTLFARFSRVDRATRRHGPFVACMPRHSYHCRLPISPKNEYPFHWVPVTSRAMALSDL
jgi:hypothetical protein